MMTWEVKDRGKIFTTSRHSPGAPGMKSTARGRMDHVRDGARNRGKLSLPPGHAGKGIQKTRRIGMHRLVEEGFSIA